MAKNINVGLVGYGFMGKAHSSAYQHLPMFFETELIPVKKVICGRTRDAVAKAAQTLNWENYTTSWKELVERDDIELVDIITPNSTHKEIAVAAAKAGKHVLCEKPLAMNIAEAQEMLDAVVSAGVKHMVCHNWQKIPATCLAKQLIERGDIGKVYQFRAVYLQDWLNDPNFPLVWRLRKDVAGFGTLGDLGSHLIDLARYLIGEFDEVIGMQKTFIKERPKIEGGQEPVQGAPARVSEQKGEVTVDDNTLFLARFKNGALGSFETSRVSMGNKNNLRIEVNGNKGSLLFEAERMNQLWLYSREGTRSLEGFRRILTTDPHHPYMKAWWPPGHNIGYEHAFIHIAYDFLKAIDEDGNPSPSFADGLECQRVLEAVQRSVDQGKWVKIANTV